MGVELSDSDLVHRIGLRQDPAAEAELFHRMAPRIRLYGLRHLRDQDAADDLVQQVLITALEALRAGRVREADKLASFVLGICRMTVRDLRRNTQRRKERMERFGGEMLVTMSESMPRLDQDRLAHCVQKLKERERTVVVMSFYDEKTGADVASFLGVSEDNVRVIRYRAIRRIRDCMGVAA